MDLKRESRLALKKEGLTLNLISLPSPTNLREYLLYINRDAPTSVRLLTQSLLVTASLCFT